jgi:transposase-like protein
MNIRVWNPEEEAELLQLYVEKKQSVQEIAEYFGKNDRSIISKLVQLRVYRKLDSSSKPPKRSVKNMLIEIEQLLEVELDSANISKKQNLETILDAIKQKLGHTTN